MPDKSILDITRLEEAFEDDRLGIAELLEMALETGKRHALALHEAIAERSLPAVARAAHSIKGSAANIGAIAVADLALAIEQELPGIAWSKIAALAAELDRAYRQLEGSIIQFRSEVS